MLIITSTDKWLPLNQIMQQGGPKFLYKKKKHCYLFENLKLRLNYNFYTLRKLKNPLRYSQFH